MKKTNHKSLPNDTEQLTAVTEESSASETAYRAIIDHIGIGVALISPRMEILTLNSRMRQWYPHIDPTRRPLCYKSFNDPPREAICSYCPTFKTLQDGTLHESMTETPLGVDIRNFRIISTPITDENGKVIAAIEMVEDMTDSFRLQKQLAESEKRYRTIFETTASGTMIVDEDTTISLVNKAFEERIGYSKKEVEGKKSWMEFIPPEDIVIAKKYHDLRRVAMHSAPARYEARFLDRKGNKRDVLVSVAMIPGTKSSICSLLDITEQKRTESALRESEQDLGAKTQMYEEVNTALRVLLKQRDDDRIELETKILVNVKEMIMPYVEKLKNISKTPDQIGCLSILETNLGNIISPFLRNITLKHPNLTPKEIQIAVLIKEGKTTKDIARILNVSSRAIEFHRDNMRTKFQIKNKKANLRAYLLSYF